MSKPRVKREDLKPGEVLCEHCTGKCCRYFALPIDTPKIREDFDHIRWYMIHGRVSIFVDEATWYLMVHADCRHLLDDNRCGIYEDRPQICRDYTTVDCEYDDDACYEKFFETPEQIWEYAEAVLPPNERPRADRDVSLPILSAVH
ncbi:MAG: YkgJ family cysteine cluster protein [Planctomycetaceae bacterium]